MNDQIPAPGPGTIMQGSGFIARANRIAEFIRQWRHESLLSNRRGPVIASIHSDPAGRPIDLVVGDLEAILNRALPVRYPDRDDLARELFTKDNSRIPDAQRVTDWEDLAAGGAETYAHRLADAAIAAFKRANS